MKNNKIELSAQNLSAGYDGKTIVSDVNITIPQNKISVILGANGCGKSTLLKTFAKLLKPEQGSILLDGKSIFSMPSKQMAQTLGLLPQSPIVPEGIKVTDLVARGRFPYRKLLGGLQKEDFAAVEEALEMMGITELADACVDELSGGQRQRVAMGRAIVRNPAVFLMDEPLSNLDAKLRNQMRAEIIKLRQRIDTTFVYVTHDQTEAMTLGDRIVIMRDGFIQQIGTPQEVFNHPANLFVAGFIGTPQMNFFDAKLDKDADGYYVELDGARVHLPEEKQQALRANNVEPQDITLGIRPEHIMLCSDDAAAHISATVDVSEMMGSSVHLHVNANGKDVVVIIPTIDLDGSAQQMFSYGSKVNFTFGGNVLHMFSKENEKNLI